MTNSITGPRHYKRHTFQQLDAPLVLTKPRGEFFPWQSQKKATRDAANGPIGEVHKKRFALSPDALAMITREMRSVGDRILALEQRKAAAMTAPQPALTHDAPCVREGTLVAEPDGSTVLLQGNRSTFINPTHRRPNGQPDTFALTPTRDTQMPTHPSGLAPNNHVEGRQAQMRDKLSFADRLRRSFSDGAKYGELPSRFTSQEQSRLASHAPGASLPSPAELNAAHQRAHAGAGASGQIDDTTQPGGAGEQPGILRRGGMLEAQPSDSSSGFASELNKIPTGSPPNVSLNLYYGALAKAKSPAARDAIDKIWSAFQRR